MPRQKVLSAPPQSHTAAQLDLLRRVRHPTSGAYAIPVFSFGDPSTAKIATISLNPSHQEFLNSHGNALPAASERFSAPWLSGTHSVASIQSDCRDYFVRTNGGSHTYYKRWFGPMERLLSNNKATTKNLSYFNGSACHLDLSPWPSDPAWANLWPFEQDAHVKLGLPVLLEQLGFPGGDSTKPRSPNSTISKIVLNGATTMQFVLNALVPGTVPKLLHVPNSKLKIATGSILGLDYVGWNLYLQRSGSSISNHVAPYI